MLENVIVLSLTVPDVEDPLGANTVSGLTMSIKDKKATHVLIDQKPLDENAIYVVANSDYIANGGDDCEILRAVPKINIGYLYRDALIEYIVSLNRQGKTIDAKTDNRIVYAN